MDKRPFGWLGFLGFGNSALFAFFSVWLVTSRRRDQ